MAEWAYNLRQEQLLYLDLKETIKFLFVGKFAPLHGPHHNRYLLPALCPFVFMK
jgi:hypothetical protein